MAPKKETITTRNLLLSRIQETFDLAQAASTDPSKIALFKIKCRFLAGTYEDFKTVHVQIQSQTPDAEAEAQDKIRKEVDDLYILILAKLDEFSPTVPTTPSGGTGAPSPTPTLSTAVNNMRLPKLELMKFSGDLKNWQTFIDIFDSSVHNCAHISEINKFQYLMTSLTSDPLVLVKSIPLTAANYELAYNTLIERYCNKRLLTLHHWRTIKNYPSLTTDNFKTLRQLIDSFSENIAVLEKLGCNVKDWDFVITDLLLDKLDPTTRKRFELNSDATVMPKYDEVKKFILKQCIALETVDTPKQTFNPTTSHRSLKHTANQSNFAKSSYTKSFVANTNQTSSTNSSSCPLCKANHFLYRCLTFMAKSPTERFQTAKQSRLCVNCLRQSHSVSNCPSQHTCRICNLKHHSLLHFNQSQSSHSGGDPNPGTQTSQSQREEPPIATTSVNACTSVSSSNNPSKTTVLLATVSFEIESKWGTFSTIRALLDPGSQASFIIDSSVKQLGLKRFQNHTPILGLSQAPTNSVGMTTCHIRPHGSQEPGIQLETLVLKGICSKLPSYPVDLSHIQSFKDLHLADPLFDKPSPIHMLLGADIYHTIVTGRNIIHDESQGPMAIHTIFGWAILGPITSVTPPEIQSFFTSVEPCSDVVLKRFWEIEEVPSNPTTSPDDKIVETLFQNTHFRTPSGRFGVTLPFKVPSPRFEKSRPIADRRFLALERRLQSNSSLQKLYFDFMQDYLSSGHMSPLSSTPDGEETYFIPHHGVLTTDGDRQKLRVVFDASAKANNHLSLNDTLYPGPKLQSDISNVLLRFRSHEIVFTCDIRQMYRQILIVPEHRKYQLIRWRFRPSDPIQTYQLNTVTYGINSSPYLAIRTLLQLAEEGKRTFPLASAALRNDIYVDDLVCGASFIETALQLRNQLIALLQTGCFELRKWSSNHPMLLEDIPLSHRQQQDLNFDSDSNTTVKILGLQWHSSLDSFTFKVVTRESPCTKRSILSEVARIYDPLGFLSPLTLFAKRLLQRLWTLGIDWDSIPPEDVQKVWSQYKLEIPCLGSLRIPRQIFNTSAQSCQLHAFCDASEVGYAGVIYLRLTDQNHQVSVHLVMAKSKVAPLKRLSIPRLELCAAVLLSKLVNFVITTYQSTLTFDQVVAWSDSTVALTWIRSSPHRWKTFVANRTTFIQERLAPSCWRHVPSADNPADPASRGLLPSDVLSCSLWWAGPTFLKQHPDYWPTDSVQTTHHVELDMEEKSIVLLAQSQPSDSQNLLNQFSSLRKIQGIFAYMLRFINKLKYKGNAIGPLSAPELHQALLRIVKLVQTESFSQEISAIRNNRKYPKHLQHLAPFLDDNGILRVGGRLTHSDLSFSAKHPALLPRKHRLTELIIQQIHRYNFHPGVNTTMYLLQQNFWVISARRAIRHYLSTCNQCFRNHPSSYAPPMGNLPQTRISQVKPFSCVGVDYAGPFNITLGKARGAKSRKAYLCLFVCFATKAIHLELASDLSTDAFLGALRRFIARRGRCSHIFSDCGSNFIGANREITRYMKLSVDAENITWNFNPPAAPHFGGLWESGVKSVKTHLYRVIGNQVLTYEELNTLFIQIESLLNSRPLCSLSSDPNDISALTPGHLLTMEPLTSVPDPDLSHLSINRLSRWQLIQQMHQAFWSRWRNEYLHNLYQRSKWSRSHLFKPANIDTLVLIKDNTAPPLKWRLGRIVELHPGSDGIARVATVRTSQGTFKRPLVKLCALPSQ